MNVVNLPSTFSEFKRLTLNSLTDPAKVAQAISGNYIEAIKGVPAQTRQILKYCSPSYCNGRPSNKIMVILAGQTGVGKSSTINVLFDDPKLCSVSDSTSETRDVAECTKTLKVLEENPPIQAYLSFVDLPGALDVDERKESPNLAKIQKFRKSHPDLNLKGSVFPQMKIRNTIYPNLVLICVDPRDARTEGPDSNLQKTLKTLKLYDVVDPERNNLVVVATKAMSVAIKPALYAEKTEKIKAKLQSSVESVLRVSNVPVVFIENCGEDYTDKEEGEDFYRLPNGERSHLNLIEKIIEVFRNNDDFLGQLLTGWYFKSSCPDKATRVVKSVFGTASTTSMGTNENLNDVDIAEASAMLASMNLRPTHETCNIATYQFHNIGFGYCPKSEVSKYIPVHSTQETHAKSICNKQFQLPTNVVFFEQNETWCDILSFETQDKYEEHLARKFGLDIGIKLIVSVAHEGRWIKDSKSANSKSLVSFLFESRVGSFRVKNPLEFLSNDLQEALSSLPSVYSQAQAPAFNSFFNKWGTHFVCEGYIGGAIKVDTFITTSEYSEQLVAELKATVSGVFRNLISAAGSGTSSNLSSSLASLRAQSESLHIVGGNAPPITSISHLTPNTFKAWCVSLKDNPTELQNSVKLYPYYNLVGGDKLLAIKNATIDYLSNEIVNKLKVTRDTFSEATVEGAKSRANYNISGGSSSGCFPPNAKALTPSGEVYLSALKTGDKVLVLAKNQMKEATFYTFLHFDPHAVAEFLTIRCGNRNTELTLTPDHLLFVLGKSGVVKSVQARLVAIGDQLIHVDEKMKKSYAKVTQIRRSVLKGLYCPLTSTGTVIVDRCLSSCYAHHSHAEGHVSLTPLRLWYAIKIGLGNYSNVRVSGKGLRDNVELEFHHGVHKYARGLQWLATQFRSGKEDFNGDEVMISPNLECIRIDGRKY